MNAQSNVKVWNIEISDTELMYLNNCSKSTRLGMVDCGMPDYLSALAVMGLTRQVNNGYQTTLEGDAFLMRPDIRERIKKL